MIYLSATKIKNELLRNLPGVKDIAIKNHKINGNNHGASGFMQYNDLIFYVSSDIDITFLHGKSLLIRKAKSMTDYCGETNNYTTLAELCATIRVLEKNQKFFIAYTPKK